MDPVPEVGIKISDPAGNRTRTVGVEVSDSANYVTTIDIFYIQLNVICISPTTKWKSCECKLLGPILLSVEV